MPRKKRRRCINYIPPAKCINKNLSNEPMLINIDEIEAIRLADYLNLNHVEAAKMMEVSRPTFTRILNVARKKIAKALIESMPIEININKDEVYIKDNKRKRFRWAQKLDII